MGNVKGNAHRGFDLHAVGEELSANREHNIWSFGCASELPLPFESSAGAWGVADSHSCPLVRIFRGYVAVSAAGSSSFGECVHTAGWVSASHAEI